MASRKRAWILGTCISVLLVLAWFFYLALTIPVSYGVERNGSLSLILASRMGQTRVTKGGNSGNMFTARLWLTKQPKSFAFSQQVGRVYFESALVARSDYWYLGNTPGPWFVELNGVIADLDLLQAIDADLEIDGEKSTVRLERVPRPTYEKLTDLPDTRLEYSNRWWRVWLFDYTRRSDGDGRPAMPRTAVWRNRSMAAVPIDPAANFVAFLVDGTGLVIATEAEHAAQMKMQ